MLFKFMRAYTYIFVFLKIYACKKPKMIIL